METLKETTNGRAVETRELPVLTPRCDVWEDAQGVHVTVEMPGVAEADLDVTVERNVLKIQGRTSIPTSEPDDTVWSEIEHGEYRRSFQLGTDADTEKVTARLAHGVLELLIPRQAPARRKVGITHG